jgi:acyl carrier protein
MNESDTGLVVREIIAGVLTLPLDQVPLNAHFYDQLDGDSLQKLEVIASIEARFGCALADEQAAASDTAEELARQVVLSVA